MSEQTPEPTKQVRVHRTYLRLVTQEYTVDVPADCDVDEWREDDPGGFDQFVCDQHDPNSESFDAIDDDQLDIKLMRAET